MVLVLRQQRSRSRHHIIINSAINTNVLDMYKAAKKVAFQEEDSSERSRSLGTLPHLCLAAERLRRRCSSSDLESRAGEAR